MTLWNGDKRKVKNERLERLQRRFGSIKMGKYSFKSSKASLTVLTLNLND